MKPDIIDIISADFVLSDADILLCKKYFQEITVSKNEILEHENKIPRNLYFLSSGFMRLFYHSAEAEEITTYLCESGQFIAPFLSLVKKTKSKENVQCITNCSIQKIERSDLEKLIMQSESFKNFSLTIFEQAINYNETRANDLAVLSAEQRYVKLLNNHPAIIQNVPIQYIASFLGITPESLSRIRRQITN
ncbi:MAG: Crp/Fnr family transcriptional regulator [Bacteroidetes bacterium]|nr:Crp/Fnr family transcriptional regulator [Bacteroidota bacterium]